MKKITFIFPISFAIVAAIGCNNKTFTVNFKNYDGTVLQSSTVKNGEKATYTGETPTRPGDDEYTYTFSAWDKDINQKITANTDFTAKYTTVTNEYTVTFDTCGEAKYPAPAKQTVKYGRTITQPSDPEAAEGSAFTTFVCWYTEDYEKFDFTMPIHNNMTLYAAWGFTVAFNDGGGQTLFNQKVPVGFRATNPGLPTPSEEGKIAYGWKYGTDIYDFSKPVMSDLSLSPAEGDEILTIEGEHNININSSNPGTLHAFGTNGGSKKELFKDDGLVWEVYEGYENIININAEGKLSIPANSPGGKAVIIAYAPNQDETNEIEYYWGIHEVEVASFSYINIDEFKKDTDPVVKGKNTNPSGKFVIPERYWDTASNDWIATGDKKILKDAFIDCTQIRSVIIPSNITAIEEGAFKCIDRWSYGPAGNLNTITFKGTPKVESIGVEAFDGQKLTSLRIPTSLNKIAPGAFLNCPLTSVVFEDQTNTKWDLQASSESVGQSVVIDIKDYSDTELAKGFSTYSWNDQTYGKGDFTWSKQI